MSAPGGVPGAGRGPGPRGGAWSWGVPGGDPPRRLLLRAVRILLECILVDGNEYPQRGSKDYLLSITIPLLSVAR